mmetsp:Transcript_98793/g.264170  ORF Transcript_98793/g.264170 Transcript_98793/m.264170 type:complete len:232 (+) Transcript_98793:1130-1825(+)
MRHPDDPLSVLMRVVVVLPTVDHLKSFVAAGEERDLWPLWNPVVLPPGPQIISAQHNWAFVSKTNLKVAVMGRFLSVTRVQRYFSKERRFIVEETADLPEDHPLQLPYEKGQPARLRSEVYSVFARRAQHPSSVVVNVSRFTTPFRAPDMVLGLCCRVMLPQILNTVLKQVELVEDPASPWQPRLRADATGFYRGFEEVMGMPHSSPSAGPSHSAPGTAQASGLRRRQTVR